MHVGGLPFLGPEPQKRKRRVFEVHHCTMLYEYPVEEAKNRLGDYWLTLGTGKFVNLVSDTNAEGKTRLYEFMCAVGKKKWRKNYRFLPEYKNREAREGEVYGRDLFYATKDDICRAIDARKVWSAYEVETWLVYEETEDESYREECIGLRVGALMFEQIPQAIEAMERAKARGDDEEYFTTIPPPAYNHFRQIIPGTVCVYFKAGMDDFPYFRERRDLHRPDIDLVVLGWGSHHPEQYPGTVRIQNKRWKATELAVEAERKIRQMRIYGKVLEDATQ